MLFVSTLKPSLLFVRKLDSVVLPLYTNLIKNEATRGIMNTISVSSVFPSYDKPDSIVSVLIHVFPAKRVGKNEKKIPRRAKISKGIGHG